MLLQSVNAENKSFVLKLKLKSTEKTWLNKNPTVPELVGNTVEEEVATLSVHVYRQILK